MLIGRSSVSRTETVLMPVGVVCSMHGRVEQSAFVPLAEGVSENLCNLTERG